MKSKQSEVLSYLGILAIVLFLGFSAFAILDGVFMLPSIVFGAGLTVTATTSVIVDNAAPTVSSVSLNNTQAITLIANMTSTIYVATQIADNNGCTDLQNGTTTILVYRSGITSSTCLTSAADNRNCYKATSFSASSTCTGGGTSVNATSTFDIWYFADSTQTPAPPTSTYPGQKWLATVIFKDPSNATGSRDSAGVDVNVLTAINITTSSVNYGTVAANNNTGATNQVTTSTNAGNSTTTLRVSAQSTLTNGSNPITTSSQKYATTTFTYNTGGTALSQDVTTISGTTMVTPTSTNTVNRAVFWGIEIPAGTATGTYTGVNLFTASYVDVAN